MSHRIIRPLTAAALFLTVAVAQAQPAVPEHFSVLAPLLGRTWRGEFSTSTPEKPVVDVQRWELVLGGKAVRVLHSINDGSYGGETMIVWDDSRKSLVYYYFTTAGFHTNGVMTPGEKNGFVSNETVIGSTVGVTEVRSTYTFNADGSFTGVSSYLNNGAWSGGREVTYREAPEASVILP